MRRSIAPVAAAALTLLAACTSETKKETPPPVQQTQTQTQSKEWQRSTPPGVDPHTFAKPEEARVDHLALDLDVDFAAKQLRGTATLRIVKAANAKALILDTRDLDIKRVTLQPGNVTPQFRLGNAENFLGRPLEIPLNPDTNTVVIDYASSPDAAALQWLDAPQTADRKHPFLLSQSESALARTWVPIQDTPQVRFTYEATIRVPKGLIALMSAENPQQKNDTGVYHFTMPQRIPSYLLAIAAGDIAFRPLGPTSGVYAEVPVVDKAANEFVDTPKMIDATEAQYGKYRWGRYDMLVLPPSFPFGGMENPRLTFLTPTLIAGDRSLVSVITHELAHSWSGNLVTNATWNEMWLNEGFTTYIERRISEKLYGADFAELLWTLGLTSLKADFASLPPGDTRLLLDLKGRDPDDGSTQVPYEKGSLMLRLLERTVGREKWDAFLRGYFDKFAFQTMTTQKFVEYLDSQFPGVGKQIEIDRWINEPGLPPNAPLPQSKALEEVAAQAQSFANGAPVSSLKTTGWTSLHWVHFVQSLPENLAPARMKELDDQYHFSQSGNSEVLEAWLEKSIATRYKDAYPAIERFLTSQGRRKFLKPLYTKLAAHPEDVPFAKQVYAKARPMYHSVARTTIDQILK